MLYIGKTRQSFLDAVYGNTLPVFQQTVESVTFPWSNDLSMWDANSATGVQFPACARSRMLTLGKLANLIHNLNSGLLLD